MRYVEGEDLSSLLRREGRLDPKRAAAIVDQIAGALDEAHARGLVHRDVKPANVIVESRRGTEHAYLTDFGLTREIDASGGVTATGRWVGTIDYASPEQIRGGPVDARCDVYALGCVLFTTLTGRLPFEREEDVAKLYAHVSEPPPKASTVAPDVSEDVDGVITRAMSKDPDFRFPSAGDMGRAALAAATGAPVAEPEHSVATGEAAPATEPAPPPVAPTMPADVPPPAEPESTVEASAARPTAPPSEPPAVATQDEPRKPARAGGRRRLAALAGVLAVGAAIAVAVVVLSGGGGGDANSGSSGGGQTTTENGSQAKKGGTTIGFVPFDQASGFTVEVPDDVSAVRVEEQLPNTNKVTTLASSDDSVSLQIQQEEDTPGETRAAEARSEREQEGPSYGPQLEFGSTKVGDQPAFLYAYQHDEPGNHGLPALGRATVFNYFFNEGGFGWRTRAAVAGEGTRSQEEAKEIATRMAETLKPTD
jgi:hypothetical protein